MERESEDSGRESRTPRLSDSPGRDWLALNPQEGFHDIIESRGAVNNPSESFYSNYPNFSIIGPDRESSYLTHEMPNIHANSLENSYSHSSNYSDSNPMISNNNHFGSSRESTCFWYLTMQNSSQPSIQEGTQPSTWNLPSLTNVPNDSSDIFHCLPNSVTSHIGRKDRCCKNNSDSYQMLGINNPSVVSVQPSYPPSFPPINLPSISSESQGRQIV